MTSYNNEPGPTNNLNEYLLRLCGFSKSTGMKSVDPTILTKEHATYVGNLMTDWLQSLLKTYALEGKYTQRYSEVGYRKEGYIYEVVTQEWGAIPDIDTELLKGNLIEIAGPSSGEDYEKFLAGIIPKVIANINPQIDGVNVVADAAHTPFRSESVGTLFISALPGAPREYLTQFATLRPEALDEAKRILQPNGYLIWLGGTADDVQDLLNNGFTPVYLDVKSCMYKYTDKSQDLYKEPQLGIDGVYKKVSK